MPPHFQMAMVQSLLVRSLVAWFWDEPLQAPLIRHGANLHGRYLLPHFIIHEIADVAADLRAHGVDFDTSWLDPFTEFRFPRIGTAVFDGVEIELRGAIEPWNVLERSRRRAARHATSTRRSSASRCASSAPTGSATCHLQRPPDPVAGHRQPRHPGRRRPVPGLAAAERAASHDHRRRAAAVRARRRSAGNVARRLHLPRIPSGWPAYDKPPVNAVEAESRRGSRFEATGFTPGQVDMSDIREKQARQSTDVGAPGILDMRRVRTVLR